MMKIDSHVSIKNGLLGAAKEAPSYGANTFMIYTGAPQNTRRSPLEKMKIEEGTEFLTLELERTTAIGSNHLVLHPGAFTDKDLQYGIERIAEGLNMVLQKDAKTNLYEEEIAYLRGLANEI